MSTTDGRENDEKPVRRRRGRRWFARLTLLLALIALASAAVVRIRIEDWARHWIDDRLESQGLRAQIGDLEIQLTRLQIELIDCELTTADETAGTLRLRLPYVRAGADLGTFLGLAAPRLELAELYLDRPQLITDDEFLDGWPPKAQRGDTGTIDLRIDRLRVAGGIWQHADRSVPMELDLERIRVTGDSKGGDGTTAGEVGGRLRLLREPLARPLVVDWQSRFRWRGRSVELSDTRAGAAGVEIELDGVVDLSDGGAMIGSGTLRADLDRFGELLDRGFPRIGGGLQGPVRLELQQGILTFELDARASRPVFDTIEARDATATVRYEPGRIAISELQATAYGGRVTGRIGLELRETERFAVALVGERLSAAELLDWIRLPLPFSAGVDASIELGGETARRSSWVGRGEFVARSDSAPALRGATLPVSGTGTIGFVDGRIELDVPDFVGGASHLHVRAVAGLEGPDGQGHVELQGATRDAALTQEATLTILRRLGVEPAEVIQQPISGSGAVRARIGFREEADVDLSLQLREGSVGGQRFDRLELDCAVSGNAARIDRLVLRSADGQIDARAEWQLEPFETRFLELDAVELSLGALLPLFEVDQPIEGRLSAKLTARTTSGGLAGSGVVGLSDVQWHGESLDAIVAEIEVEGDQFRFLDVVARGDAVVGRGELAWDQRQSVLTFDLTEVSLEPAKLSSLGLPAERELSGTLSLIGQGQISSNGPTGELRVQWEKLDFDGFDPGPGFGTLRLAPEGLNGSIQSTDLGRWAVDGSLEWQPDLPLHAVLRLDHAEIDVAPDSDPPVRSELSGWLSVDGPLTRPEELAVEGELSEAALMIGARRLELLAPTRVAIGDHELRIGTLKIAGPVSDVEIDLRYALESGRLATQARGTLDLALLNLLVPEIRAQGEVEVALESDGTLTEPGISGAASIVQGRMRYLGFPHTVEAIDVIFEIEEGRAAFDDLRAVVGGGELLGLGEVEVGRGGIGALDLTLEAIDVRVALPEGFAAVYDGVLQLRGPLEELVLSGRLDLVQGIYDEPFDIGGMLGYRTRQYATVDAEGLPDQVTLDIELFAADNVWVRNDLAQLETRFDLHLGGTPRLPEIGGRLEVLEGGKLRFRDVDYRVEAASLDFAESDRLNPYLTLDARTTVREFDVFLHVEGPLDRVEYELTSSPSLSTQDIITLLATGSTLEELRGSGRGGALTGDVAAVYFAGALGDRFEKQLGRSLGLDRLQIDPSLTEGSDATTRVTVGKRVNDHLNVIVSTEVGSTEDELYQIEWQASPRSRMTVQRDTNGGVGSDIFYTKRYWWRKPGETANGADEARRSPTRPQLAGPPESTVRSVRIEGVDEDRRRELQQLVPVEPDASLRRSAQFEGRQAIRGRFVKEGHIEVSVISEVEEVTPGLVDVVYRIDPGPQVEVRLEGIENKKEQKQIRQRLEELWTEALYERDLEYDSVELVRKFYEELGYYAADVYAERAATADGALLRLRVDRGQPVRVSSIQFRGVIGIDESRLRRQLLTRPSGVFANRRFEPEVLREDLVALRNLYRDEGFLQVRIRDPEVRLAIDGGSVDIIVDVSEGPQFRIGAIELRGGEPFAREQLIAWLGFAPDQPFSPTSLLQASVDLKRALDERGHPDARVVPNAQIDGSTVALEIEIDAGSEIHVQEIRISGNQQTQEAVIRRQLTFATGEPLSREKIRRSQHALYRLGVFRNVRIEYRPIDAGDASRQLVEVRVTESQPLSVALGIGYNTESKLNLSFSTAKQNIRGRLASLALQGRWNEDLRRLQLVSKSPRIFGANVPVLTNLLWEEDQQTDGFTVERWSTAVRVERQLSERWKGFVRYGYQVVDIFDILDPLAVQDEKLEAARLGDVGLTLGRNTLDDELLPTRGNRFLVSLQLFAEPVLSEFDFVKLSLSESHRWRFGNGISFVTAARLGFIEPYGSTTDVPISERFFAGGSTTVRGFDTDRLGPLENDLPIGGEAMLILNQELRLPFWRTLKGVAFYDAGNVYRRSGNFDASDLRHVLGLGVRYETPIGPLRAEYGWKLDREPGESGGQFFFSIGNAF